MKQQEQHVIVATRSFFERATRFFVSLRLATASDFTETSRRKLCPDLPSVPISTEGEKGKVARWMASGENGEARCCQEKVATRSLANKGGAGSSPPSLFSLSLGQGSGEGGGGAHRRLRGFREGGGLESETGFERFPLPAPFLHVSQFQAGGGELPWTPKSGKVQMRQQFLPLQRVPPEAALQP